jgi:uncharacterized membrane protein HdeD (DUF308 family)
MATATYPTTHRSGWTITEGILLIVVGILALAAPLVTAELTALLLPFVLLVEGIVLIVSAFGGRTFGSAVWHILLGAVALVAAVAVFAQPAIAIVSLPLIVGAYLVFKGLVQVGIAVSGMTSGRGWMWASAVLNIVLGLLLFTQTFGASLVLTGIYIGASILVLGILLLVAPGTTSEDTMTPAAM